MTESRAIELKHISEITFDVENARIPVSVRREDKASVLEWMINHENITDLMTSIGEKGFFPGEPLLVVKDEKTGLYVTVEGNRRYTATYLLQNPDEAPVRKSTVNDIVHNAEHRPDQLPVVIFESRDEIVDYLGYRHITGVEPWDALAKARYLRMLYDRLRDDMPVNEKYRTLARQIGSKPSYVRQLLIGSSIVEVIEGQNYYSIKDLDDKTFEFGSFYTAIVKPNIARYIGVDMGADNPLDGLNTEHLGELVSWMFEKNGENQTRVGESRNLNQLNKILDPRYEKALVLFKEGASLTKATELTDEADEIVRKKISDARDALQTAWSYFPSVKDYDGIKLDILLEINKTSAIFYKTLKDKVQKSTELEELS